MSHHAHSSPNTKTPPPSTRRTFVPAKEAAAFVSYSPDYISRLAREGKVAAEQRNRQWYVSLDSLKLFSLKQQAEQRARQKELREQRLAEYAQTRVADVKTKQKQNLTTATLPALLLSAATTLCVALVGMLSWVSFEAKLQPAALFSGAGTVLETVEQVVPFSNWFGRQDFVGEANEALPAVPAHQVRVTETGLLVQPGTPVSEMVSDPVEVRVVSSSTMVLEPVFLPPAEEPYFVEVTPVSGETVEQSNENSL